MAAQSRRKGAAQCAECDRALAVWISADGVRPIGSTGGCPCGGTAFRRFD